jgi:hypothetical protein
VAVEGGKIEAGGNLCGMCRGETNYCIPTKKNLLSNKEKGCVIVMSRN